MTSLFEEITSPPADDVPVRRVTITVNGLPRTLDVEPRLLLAHLLRQGLQLTGTHTGCDTTNCGACTVLFDGTPVKSCTMLAVQADGHEVQTVEGLGTASELDPVQEGFKEEHGLQCGFCTPGMMMASRALLNAEPRPDRGRGAVRAVGQPVPLHRLPEHRQGRAVGRRARARRRDRPAPTAPPPARATLPSSRPGGLR